jgi:glycosyltransferase involved in cell wall biosynthesis
MHNADALLFPSRSEGHPLVAIEAVACGLPVIATRHPAVCEAIEDGINGFLCTQNNVDEFAIAAKKLREIKRSNSINKSKPLFSIELMITQYFEAYKKLER